MRNMLITVGLLISGSISSPVVVAQAQRDSDPGAGRDASTLRAPMDRFDGTVTLKTKDGKVRQLRVVVRNWIIDNRRQVAKFPEKGFMVVQLRGGELATTIDGKRQQRKEDEFWTVRAGSAMGVETGNDSAIVQILAITEQR
jgi:hypothetical protein